MKKFYILLLFVTTQFISCDKTPTEPPETPNYHNKILFTSSRSGKEQLYMINPDGSNITQITKGEYSHSNGRWYLTTNKIGCITNQNSNTACQTVIEVIDNNGGNGKLLTCGNFLSWSPDGKKIAYIFRPQAELGDLSAYIYIYDIETAEITKIISTKFLIIQSLNWYGNKIFFSSNLDDITKNLPEIYFYDLEDSSTTRLTFTEDGYSVSPSISYNGGKIAFVSKPKGDNEASIYVMNIDGSNIQKIVSPPHGEVFNYPYWSADGKYLVLVSGITDGSQKTFVYKVDLTNKKIIKLINDDSTANNPFWIW